MRIENLIRKLENSIEKFRTNYWLFLQSWKEYKQNKSQLNHLNPSEFSQSTFLRYFLQEYIIICNGIILNYFVRRFQMYSIKILISIDIADFVSKALFLLWVFEQDFQNWFTVRTQLFGPHFYKAKVTVSSAHLHFTNLTQTRRCNLDWISKRPNFCPLPFL